MFSFNELFIMSKDRFTFNKKKENKYRKYFIADIIILSKNSK